MQDIESWRRRIVNIIKQYFDEEDYYGPGYATSTMLDSLCSLADFDAEEYLYGKQQS